MADNKRKMSVKVAMKATTKRVVAKASRRKVAPKSPLRKPAQVALLAGGNPQIAKADGDAPVQAYKLDDIVTVEFDLTCYVDGPSIACQRKARPAGG